MSSRSFRRRNNRRRHKASGAQDGQGQKPEVPQGERSAGPRRPHPPEGPQKGGGQRREGRGPAGNAGRAAEPQRPAEPEVPIVYPDCPICSKPVRDLASALTHRVSRQPAHFDCIVQELRDTNEIAPQEKICYLGGGSFGILEFRSSGGPGHFVIKKRIQYEEKESPQDWKKPLQVTW